MSLFMLINSIVLVQARGVFLFRLTQQMPRFKSQHFLPPGGATINRLKYIT